MLYIEINPGLLGVYTDLNCIVDCATGSNFRKRIVVLLREYRPFYGHQDVEQPGSRGAHVGRTRG